MNHETPRQTFPFIEIFTTTDLPANVTDYISNVLINKFRLAGDDYEVDQAKQVSDEIYYGLQFIAEQQQKVDGFMCIVDGHGDFKNKFDAEQKGLFMNYLLTQLGDAHDNGQMPLYYKQLTLVNDSDISQLRNQLQGGGNNKAFIQEVAVMVVFKGSDIKIVATELPAPIPDTKLS